MKNHLFQDLVILFNYFELLFTTDIINAFSIAVIKNQLWDIYIYISRNVRKKLSNKKLVCKICLFICLFNILTIYTSVKEFIFERVWASSYHCFSIQGINATLKICKMRNVALYTHYIENIYFKFRFGTKCYCKFWLIILNIY